MEVIYRVSDRELSDMDENSVETKHFHTLLCDLRIHLDQTQAIGERFNLRRLKEKTQNFEGV